MLGFRIQRLRFKAQVRGFEDPNLGFIVRVSLAFSPPQP